MINSNVAIHGVIDTGLFIHPIGGIRFLVVICVTYLCHFSKLNTILLINGAHRVHGGRGEKEEGRGGGRSSGILSRVLMIQSMLHGCFWGIM